MTWLDDIRWDRDGLVPVIAQERSTKDVLMLAWMNREALTATVQRGQAVYWSRSRQRLWHKGEASGHVQQVHDIRLDCDNDVLLLSVTQHGSGPGEPAIACHTGRHSCFFQQHQAADDTNASQGPHWRSVETPLKDPKHIYGTAP